MKSWKRIGLIAVVAVLAFGAGLVLRGWGDERSTVASEAAAPVGGDNTFRPIGLIRADPGALRRPARERSPEPTGPVPAAAPAAPAPAPAAVAPAPPPPTAAPAPDEAPAPPDDGDSNSPDPPPDSTFDSEG